MVGTGGLFDSLRRRVFSLPVLVSLVVAGGFLLFLAARFDVDLGLVWERVRSCDPWLLAAAFAAHYMTFFLRGARWRILLERRVNASGGLGQVPGLLFCTRAVLLGWFVNSISWLRLGDVYRGYLYHEEYDGPFSGAMGTVFAERVLDVFLVAVLLLVTVPFLVGRTDGELAWGLLTGAAASLVLLLVVGLAAVLRLRSWLLRLLPGWLAGPCGRFLEGVSTVGYRPVQTTALGVLGWLAEIGRLYLVSLALGFELGPALVVFLTFANSVLTLVPTPGGIGAVEPGVAGLAVRLAAVGREPAAALVLVDRVISYLSVIVVGAAVFAVHLLFRRRAGRDSR